MITVFSTEPSGGLLVAPRAWPERAQFVLGGVVEAAR